MKRAFSTISAAAARATTPGTQKRWLEKINARVFCPHDSEHPGGNPVTIFATLDNGDDDSPSSGDEDFLPQNLPLSLKTQAQLAQSCSWESVVVQSNPFAAASPDEQHGHALSFFMPNGAQVSFCAHAALAGAIRVAQDMEEPTELHCPMLEQETKLSNDNTSNSNQFLPPIATVHENDIVSLQIRKTPFEKHIVEHSPILYRLLREQCNLSLEHLPNSKAISVPTFCNVTVAAGRTKTLVYVKDVPTLLNVCQAPEDADLFARACQHFGGAAGGTTGLYLYTHHPDMDSTFVCRQFPVHSGYAEDPATGVAAAALAASLPDPDVPYVRCLQGEVLQRPSLLLVEEVELELNEEEVNEEDAVNMDDISALKDHPDLRNVAAEPLDPVLPPAALGTVSYKLLGKIEIDDTEEIEVEDELDGV